MKLVRRMLPALLGLTLASQSPAQGVGGFDPAAGGTGAETAPPTRQEPVQPKEPPGYGGPGDTTPPPGPTDPPPGGPGPPPPGPGDPGDSGGPGQPPFFPGTAPPSVGPPPGLTPPLAPTTPLTLGGPIDLTRWSLWWDLNKEPYLAVKAHVYTTGPMTAGGEGFFLGRGQKETRTVRPSPTEVFGQVVPALLRVLDRERQSDVIAGALIAIARIGDDRVRGSRSDYEQAIRRFLLDSNQMVVEAAVIALGILGDEASAPLLADLLHNAPAGQRALAGGRVSTRVRALAAYALGLLANGSRNEDVRRFAVGRLARALETDRSARSDVQAACVTAIGLIPLEDRAPPQGHRSRGKEGPRPVASSLAAEIEYLSALLDQRQRDRLVRAQVPLALGRLLEEARGPNVEDLKALVTRALFARIGAHKRQPREVVQSCVIALGRIGDDDSDPLDVRIRRTLIRIEDTTGDLPSRQLALIALGRVGGRRGAGEPSDLDETRRYLIHELVRGGTTMRPWAALALGILERGRSAAGVAPDTELRGILRLALARARALREVGAYSIANGLVGDPEAEQPLLLAFRAVDDDEARGHAAVALGLLPAPAAREELRQAMTRSTFRPRLLRETATALALLEDRPTVPLLVEMLGEARGLASQSSISSALGRIGDRSAIAPLLDMLRDETLTSRGRSFAAAALGGVADQDPLPWNTVLSVGANVHAAPPTLFDLGGGVGVLNML